MMSGQNPFNHGVRWLLDFETDATLLQEYLDNEGYNTAAFVGGYPLPTGNFDKGFDTFEPIAPVDDRHEGRKEYGPANLVVSRAVNWLEDHKEEDNFVFLHLFDLHFTYRSELGRRDPPKTDEQGAYRNVEQYIGRRKRRYYEEADFVARQIELLHDLIDVDYTIVTGDHGAEMAYEHGYPWNYDTDGERLGAHFWGAELYDTAIRVPLFFNGPEFDAEIDHRQVRSIDIVPTLLDTLDIEYDPLDGQSLNQDERAKFAYSETYNAQLTSSNKQAYKHQNQYGFGWDLAPRVCLRSNEWKLICTAEHEIEPVELYYVAQDASEAHNLIDEREDMVERLYNRLMEDIGDDDQPQRTGMQVDEKTRETLEDLGYM
jgi:arylsulfatase A-like enzyme